MVTDTKRQAVMALMDARTARLRSAVSFAEAAHERAKADDDLLDRSIEHSGSFSGWYRPKAQATAAAVAAAKAALAEAEAMSEQVRRILDGEASGAGPSATEIPMHMGTPGMGRHEGGID